MYALAGRLFPICRSITGDGFRRSLEMIREEVPEMTVHEVPTGTEVFDWTVPREWNIRGGWIKDMRGERRSLTSRTATCMCWAIRCPSTRQ